jgi:hypothetical protein
LPRCPLILLVLFPALLAAGSAAQQVKPKQIQDNSFLVEEAYNQDEGVVQHISTFTRLWNSRDWTYSFTQEWPGLHNPRNQYSYTVNLVSAGAFPRSGPGLGDIELNYRYQVLGTSDTRLAFAPRLSLLLPTGNSRVGRGSGSAGLQTDLPVSFLITPWLASHSNAGATWLPRARDAAGDRALATGVNLGQSFIWLAKPRFNLMFETYWTAADVVVGAGRTQRQQTLLLNPGARWAFNFASGLQIVPGVAVPLGAGPSAGEKGLLLYLSFEHPFRAPRGASPNSDPAARKR